MISRSASLFLGLFPRAVIRHIIFIGCVTQNFFDSQLNPQNAAMGLNHAPALRLKSSQANAQGRDFLQQPRKASALFALTREKHAKSDFPRRSNDALRKSFACLKVN